ncbi:spore coat protein [Ornithinibacillus gellani]|uniref:spore coat protein n=1 Tax=Ornithinibacillus gellani TaxID=2293253 RepID=UPI000F46F3FB|nr:spore coat protein [Ornithinibacillus gellani]TQS75404.1 spore coat protein [Ornithinibacillus gellani]
MRHRHGPRCGCGCKQIVYPVKENVVNNCTKSVVKHIHPSHTTVMNHHLVENVHLFPHSTSVVNTQNQVNINGGSFPVPAPPNQVGGAMSPGSGNQVGGMMQPGMGPGQQVGGAMQPGNGPGQQVGGMMQPGWQGCGMKKPQNKWC